MEENSGSISDKGIRGLEGNKCVESPSSILATKQPDTYISFLAHLLSQNHRLSRRKHLMIGRLSS